uniref:Factor of DNA methylation 1-5/IDN2 domain-containing protein n=1 Tax=Oryza brachyantha TaxID=4533 RepID=J3KWF3_ORYBR
MADADTDNAGGELIVWPWPGVPATATGDDDASAATTLTVHSQQHFAGVPTTALQEAAAHDGHGHRHHLAGARRRECRQLRRRDEGATAGAGEEGLPGDGAAGRFLPEASCAARSAEDELRKITECIMLEMNHDVHDENGRVASELDETGKEIDTKSQRIEELKGALEISSMMLPSGQCSVGDHAQMLQEIHKQDMEVIYAKLEQLEKQLEQRQALESTVRQLNMKIQAGERLRHDDYEHIYSIMICLRTIIDEEKERLVDSCADLIKRVQMNFSELRELRQELIKGFENMTISKNTIIGIKRMGELDDKPFHLACKRKHRDDDPWGKAAMLISYWQEELKKPSWHPFTTIQVDGEEKEVVDGDDPKLRQLCIDYGISVCNAVKAAMAELNEYNPRGRHVTNELWNFREGRKATTSEVVKYILKQLKTSSSQPDN